MHYCYFFSDDTRGIEFDDIFADYVNCDAMRVLALCTTHVYTQDVDVVYSVQKKTKKTNNYKRNFTQDMIGRKFGANFFFPDADLRRPLYAYIYVYVYYVRVRVVVVVSLATKRIFYSIRNYIRSAKF